MHKITFVIAIVPRLNDSIFIVIYHVSYNIHEITEASVDAHLYIYIGSVVIHSRLRGKSQHYTRFEH